MAQQTPRPNRDRDPNGGGGAPEPNFNWRGLILFAAAIALIGGAFYMRSPMANAVESCPTRSSNSICRKDGSRRKA